MVQKDNKQKQSATHPNNTAELDTGEAGPSRLFAPGKPREVEAGHSRLGVRTLQRQKTALTQRPAFSVQRVESNLDTTEAGGPRVAQHRK